MRRKNLVVFLLMLGAGACQYDPYANNYTTHKPQTLALAGRYVFQSQTVDEAFKTSMFENEWPMIIINSDMTYEVKNLPRFRKQSVGEYLYVDFINSVGKWEFQEVGAIDSGFGKSEPHWGMSLNSLSDEYQSPGFMGDKMPYKIIFGFGDPDSGDVIIFEREIQD